MGLVVEQLVAIVCADDTVQVMNFVVREFNKDGTTRWARVADHDSVEATVQQAALSFDKEKLPVKGWHFITRAELPTDRTYRNALRHDGEKFFWDMAHARSLHRDLLREARTPRLVELDVAYMRALEAGDSKAAADVASQKQSLRDITDDPRIDAATTIEELKAVIPDALKG